MKIKYQNGKERESIPLDFLTIENNLKRIAQQCYEIMKKENISVHEGYRVLDFCKNRLSESKIN